MNFFGKKKEKSAGFSQKVHAFKEKPRLQYLLPWRNIDPAGIVYGKTMTFLPYSPSVVQTWKAALLKSLSCITLL